MSAVLTPRRENGGAAAFHPPYPAPVPPYALQLVIALALAGLTFLVGYPLRLGSGGSVDALDAFLLVFALVNLRVSWTAANGMNGGRAPAWFVVLGLLTAALITWAMIRALTPR